MSSYIRVVSGSNKLENGELEQDVKIVAISAIKAAITRMLTANIETVALDTGLLRKSITEKFFAEFQLADQIFAKGNTWTHEIDFNREEINQLVSYGGLHLNPGGQFKFYKNPTTPGTKPVDRGAWMSGMAELIDSLIVQFLREKGYSVS